MDPIVTGSLISAGASLLGGLFGSKGSRDANQQNERLQREFAQNGIRWKVADAQAAGLHPLFALGGSGATYTPAAQNVLEPMSRGLSDMGQNVSRAVQAQATPQEQKANELQLELLRSQIKKNEAEAAAVESQATRSWLESLASRPLNLDGGGLKADPFWALSTDAYAPRGRGAAAQAGLVKTNPSERNTNLPGSMAVEAATSPAYKRYFTSPVSDMTSLAYASEEGYGEARENMAPLEFFLANYGAGGWDWLRRYLQETYMGVAPKFHQVGSKKWYESNPRPGWHSVYKRGPGRSQ